MIIKIIVIVMLTVPVLTLFLATYRAFKSKNVSECIKCKNVVKTGRNICCDCLQKEI